MEPPYTSDPFTAGYRQAIADSGGESTAERMLFTPEIVSADGLFTPPVRRAFANTQRLDLDGLIGRARSASYVPKDGEAGTRLLESLRALHAHFADRAGLVTLVYETELYLAQRA